MGIAVVDGRRRAEERVDGRAGGGRVDQVWTPGVRVSAAKMDWLISKHLNPSMSEAAAAAAARARKRATSGGGGKIGDGRSYASLSNCRLLPLLPSCLMHV